MDQHTLTVLIEVGAPRCGSIDCFVVTKQDSKSFKLPIFFFVCALYNSSFILVNEKRDGFDPN